MRGIYKFHKMNNLLNSVLSLNKAIKGWALKWSSLTGLAAVILTTPAGQAAVTATSYGQELSGLTTITGYLTLSQGVGTDAWMTNVLMTNGMTLERQYGGAEGDLGHDYAVFDLNGLSWRNDYSGNDGWYGCLMTQTSWNGITGSLYGPNQKNLDYSIRPFSQGEYTEPSKAGIKFMAHNLGDIHYDTVKTPPLYIFYGHQNASLAQTSSVYLDAASRVSSLDLNTKPMMELGGDSHLLKLIHVTDNTKSIVMDPTAGSITIHGKAVLTQGTGGAAFLTSNEIGASYIDTTELAAALAADRTTSDGLYLTPAAAGTTYLSQMTANNDYLKKADASTTYTDATELEDALENYQPKDAAINTSASATVGGALTATGLATLNGGATVVGSTVVTGTLSVGGTGGANGTITAKKIRVPAGGDLPMDPAFTADGGLGTP